MLCLVVGQRFDSSCVEVFVSVNPKRASAFFVSMILEVIDSLFRQTAEQCMARFDCDKPSGKNVQPDFEIDIKVISTKASRGPVAGMEVVGSGPCQGQTSPWRPCDL
jgi:hypothetical protein